MSSIPFVFFGTGQIAAGALVAMEEFGAIPALVVSAPDKPAGRGRAIAPSAVALWASQRGIEVLKPEKLDDKFISKLEAQSSGLMPVFVVIDYGAFLPKRLLEMPERGILNMHPSLLPRLRGPSPIRSAILNDEKNTGVSVMLVDEAMDHGPLVAQKKVAIAHWPPLGRELDGILAREGGKLLAEIVPHWAAGEIEAREQNHDIATYSQKFSKVDGLLDLARGDAYQNLLKIRAFEGWPSTYAFFEKGGKRIRVQILEAHIENAGLVVDTVKPDGKKEMHYVDFVREGATPLRAETL